MRNQHVRINVFKDRANRCIAMCIDQFDEKSNVLATAKLEWSEVPSENLIYRQPTLMLSDTHCQKLMDDLWDCGFRPAEGAGTAGQLSATQAHLQDMRRLAFGHLTVAAIIPKETAS